MALYRVRTGIVGFGGGPFLSTNFFDAAAGTATQAADAVRAFWAGLASLMTTGVLVQVEPEVAQLDTATGALTAILPVTEAVVTGTSSGDPLPAAAQALVRWGTGTFLNGRQLKGRTFIPTLTELANTNTRVNAAALSTIATQAQNLMTAANTDLVVWHRPTVALPSSGSFGLVTTHSTWDDWAVLRSRRD